MWALGGSCAKCLVTMQHWAGTTAGLTPTPPTVQLVNSFYTCVRYSSSPNDNTLQKPFKMQDQWHETEAHTEQWLTAHKWLGPYFTLTCAMNERLNHLNKNYTEAKHSNCFSLFLKKKSPSHVSQRIKRKNNSKYLNEIWNLPFEPI